MLCVGFYVLAGLVGPFPDSNPRSTCRVMGHAICACRAVSCFVFACHAPAHYSDSRCWFCIYILYISDFMNDKRIAISVFSVNSFYVHAGWTLNFWTNRISRISRSNDRGCKLWENRFDSTAYAKTISQGHLMRSIWTIPIDKTQSYEQTIMLWERILSHFGPPP